MRTESTGVTRWSITRGAFGRGAMRALALAALATLTALTTGACGPGEAKAPNPTRPLDERRAIEVIRRAIRNEGENPDPGRDEPLVNGAKPVHIDVGVKGHAYGVAYITSEEAEALATAIPTANKKDEKLKLVRAGAGGDVHVVLLYQQNYLYDDLAGEVHEKTTITAESALARDVQDFVTYARSQKYK
jgi:hypothetical protein